jgi:predicted phage terminase large subunit-like protein
MRTELGSAAYAAQYEQQPAPEQGNMLKHEWLRSYDFAPTRERGDMIVQSWDTAFKANESSDYSACLTFLVRNKNQYYLLDAFRDKLEFPKLMDEICQRALKYAADSVLIEDKASGTSATQHLKNSGLQRVVSIVPYRDKQTRMYTRTPDLEAGSLLIPSSAPWRGQFVQEYLEFPAGKHDDQIDALSQFLTWQFGRRSDFFDFDFGNEPEGAPSADQMLRYLGR